VIPSPRDILFAPEESTIVSCPSPRLNRYVSFPEPPCRVSVPVPPSISSLELVPIILLSPSNAPYCSKSLKLKTSPFEKEKLSICFEKLNPSLIVTVSDSSENSLASSFSPIIKFEPSTENTKSSAVIASPNFNVS